MTHITRKPTRTIHLGNIKIGSDNPILVQSMTNTQTQDIAATVSQIHRLTSAGCEIIRVAVPDMVSAQAISQIKNTYKYH
ncbi:MAG: hypothetical protein OMM_06218 [Candidatus Magnetoglobus multicellularis str. Araruama]|uniref:IspG TIM-barrel domain-containing protein n=1 Tax=Candidatus Magnetoglobus multicellularis str. Araruama TaxID=890399 RepID=A0A1V1PIT5_9BACT|nr:MAG: hypothetical protein OMM_06218 [Candidatus Magnetoglobus multicellularis str. Araruama]